MNHIDHMHYSGFIPYHGGLCPPYVLSLYEEIITLCYMGNHRMCYFAVPSSIFFCSTSWI